MDTSLKPGDKVKMNDKYFVPSKEKDVIHEVLSMPWMVCGTWVVKISGRSAGYAVDGLTKVE